MMLRGFSSTRTTYWSCSATACSSKLVSNSLCVDCSGSVSGKIRRFHSSPRLHWQEWDNKIWSDIHDDPIRRLRDSVTYDYRRMKARHQKAKNDVYQRKNPFTYPLRQVIRGELLPFSSDVLIIGGGIIGSSIAWWQKQRLREEEQLITVVEDDDLFPQSSSILGLGAIRTQFSNPDFVQLSLLSAEFIRHAGEHLRILDSDPPDINFIPMGFLFLATDNEKAARMEENYKMQNHFGAKVAFLSQEELKQKFPFMRFDDVVAGTIGLENEGIFDSWALLSAIREKNLTLGVQYIKGRVEKLIWEGKADADYRDSAFNYDEPWKKLNIMGAHVRLQKTDSAPRPIRAGLTFNCAGPWAGEIAKLGEIGHGPGSLSIPVTIEKRKRFVFVVHCPDGPGLHMPYLNDPTGVWCHREDYGNTYLCGKEPSEEEDMEIDHSNLDVDFDYFYDRIWPVLARRVPAFEKLKVKNAWAGYYDYNYYDQNPLIGPNIAFPTLFNVCGFGRNGLQHAVTIGKCIMEDTYDFAYKTVNLRKYGMERMMIKKKLQEDYSYAHPDTSLKISAA